MTQEEKAKAYDEALERARKMLNMILDNELLGFPDQIREIFPQLKKNEDEGIRKALIDALKVSETIGELKFRLPYPTREECIAYLEKQKEQKEPIPYTDFVIKPHKGDDSNPYDMRVSEAQEYAINRGFGIPFNDGEVYVDERHMTQTIGNIIRWADEHPKEQKPVECELEDAFKYYTDAGITVSCGDIVAKPKEQKPAEWRKNDTAFLNEITDFFENKTVRLQHDIDMYAHWLKSLPERFGLQPKQECSEENSKMVSKIIDVITGYHPTRSTKENEEMIAWLRSISFNLKKKNEDVAKLCSNEWNEEDERILKGIIGLIDHDQHYGVSNEEMLTWLKSLRPQPQKELSIEKAIKWLDDTFYFLDNSSGRGRDCEITTHDFDSLEEMYDSFRKAVIVDSEPQWKPSEEDIKMLEHIIGQYETGNKNSKVMGYLPRVEELSFLKKVLAIWKS